MNCRNEGEVGRGPGGTARGILYTTFHFPEHLVNVVTSSECDEDTMCPESRVSGHKSNSIIWLQSGDSKELKSVSASSSWRGIFSKGWTLRSCKVLCSVPGSASCSWRMATMR
jgi:hypothetical protein